MMTTREAHEKDIEPLSVGLRDADKQEVAALERTPQQAIRDGIETSEYCHVIVDDEDNPVGIFGVGAHPLDPEFGIIWMLCTPYIQREPMRFLRNTHRYIETLFEVGNYKILTNCTDARNTLHHKWILWCGGEFTDRVPLGANGEEFLQFVIKRK
jgi:hypothetical protein